MSYTYKVRMGHYEMPNPYGYCAQFILDRVVEVSAPSAGDAKARAEQMFPKLLVDRVGA